MHACNQPGRLRKWLPSCTVTDLILVYSARLPSIKSQPERIVRLLDRASVRRLKDTCSNLPDAVVMQAPTPGPDRFLRFLSPASSHIMCRKAAQSLEVIQSSSEKRRKKRKKKTIILACPSPPVLPSLLQFWPPSSFSRGESFHPVSFAEQFVSPHDLSSILSLCCRPAECRVRFCSSSCTVLSSRAGVACRFACWSRPCLLPKGPGLVAEGVEK